MAAFLLRIRLALAAVALLIFAATLPATAQRVSPTDPNANAVSEQQLFQQLNRIRGLGTIPDTKSYTIEQPMGRVWRSFHEVWLHWIGTIFILGMVAILAIYYFAHGRNPIEGGRSGRKIVRFTGVERSTHWVIAVSFVILAITGLNITFGKDLLLPLIGPAAFSRWAIAAKYAHDFSSFPFVIGIVVLFFLWAGQNLFTRVDIEWLKEGGGMIGHKHPPAYKFNGGQKLLFWLVMLATVGVAASGFNLLFPFYLTNILGMQAAQATHALIAVAFVALIIGHIYIGTLGMEGAFEAMGEGEVDLNWAKQHHPLWIEQELAQGRGAEPPTTPQTAPAA
jgi:formate dehydrogenase subunit gamma